MYMMHVSGVRKVDLEWTHEQANVINTPQEVLSYPPKALVNP